MKCCVTVVILNGNDRKNGGKERKKFRSEPKLVSEELCED